MYKQMILAICFATVSLFSIPQVQATAGNPETTFFKTFHLKTDLELLSMTMQFNEKQLEKEKVSQFGAALSTAVIQDTVKAMLAGDPLPPDASPDCIEEAKARVKKIKRKAEKMGVDANLTSKKKKASDRRREENDMDDNDSGDEM